jgi:thioredoxin-related protein
MLDSLSMNKLFRAKTLAKNFAAKSKPKIIFFRKDRIWAKIV